MENPSLDVQALRQPHYAIDATPLLKDVPEDCRPRLAPQQPRLGVVRQVSVDVWGSVCVFSTVLLGTPGDDDYFRVNVRPEMVFFSLGASDASAARFSTWSQPRMKRTVKF